MLGDYDVDGITSVALIISYLRPLAEAPDTPEEQSRFQPYIPDRQREGYGISMMAVDFAKENGFSLIIALDCGVKAVEQVAYANTQGVDFIICDHHLPGDELPPAVALLDPKRPDCSYPYPELSGCGVGFKLWQAFTGENGFAAGPALRPARPRDGEHRGRCGAGDRRKPHPGRPRPAPLQRDPGGGFCPAPSLGSYCRRHPRRPRPAGRTAR
ncbi:MAG: DHH family phosphoesterase [Hymenobacter sp.]